MTYSSIFIVLYAGLTHAFETDHLLAISNIVSQRKNFFTALKDGIFWGLGHTSTILLVGLFMIAGKMNIEKKLFSWFEAGVGLMLITLSLYRISNFIRKQNKTNGGKNTTPVHSHQHLAGGKHTHNASYGIGLIHGLAGSGALVLLAITQFQTTATGMGYLLIFGIGSVLGMLLAASLLFIPFSKKVIHIPGLQSVLVIASSVFCFVYGIYVVWRHITFT